MTIEAAKSPESKSPNNAVTDLPCEWPYRLLLNIAVLGMTALIAGVIVTLKNDLVNKKIEEIKGDLYHYTAEHGLGIDDIVLSGRDKTTRAEVVGAVGLKRGDNILEADIFAIKQRLEALPWVRRAVVRRSFFPNVILIRLEEKEVKAIWQINEKFYPIDGDGKVIAADFRSQEPLLLIVGAGAPEKVRELISTVRKNDDDFYHRIKVANFISQRRWNLILDDIENGITIKLPEDHIEAAWKKLLKLNREKGLLKRKLTIIDLRLPDKVIVKLKKTPGTVPPEADRQNQRNM